MEPALLLIASMLPLVLGPFLMQSLGRDPFARLALRAGVGVAVAGVLLLHVLPHSFGVGGAVVVVAAALGWLLSLVLHRWHQMLRAGLFGFALAGLALHAFLDGVALFAPAAPGSLSAAEQAPGGPGLLLALAVILHRLPVAIAIWWLGCRFLSRRAALGLIVAVALATIIGFALAGFVLPLLSSPAIAWIQGFIAGMLVHIVSEGSAADFQARAWWTGVSCGVLLLAASFVLHRPEAGGGWLALALPILAAQLVFMWLRASRDGLARSDLQ